MRSTWKGDNIYFLNKMHWEDSRNESGNIGGIRRAWHSSTFSNFVYFGQQSRKKLFLGVY